MRKLLSILTALVATIILTIAPAHAFSTAHADWVRWNGSSYVTSPDSSWGWTYVRPPVYGQQVVSACGNGWPFRVQGYQITFLRGGNIYVNTPSMQPECVSFIVNVAAYNRGNIATVTMAFCAWNNERNQCFA